MLPHFCYFFFVGGGGGLGREIMNEITKEEIERDGCDNWFMKNAERIWKKNGVESDGRSEYVI